MPYCCQTDDLYSEWPNELGGQLLRLYPEMGVQGEDQWTNNPCLHPLATPMHTHKYTQTNSLPVTPAQPHHHQAHKKSPIVLHNLFIGQYVHNPIYKQSKNIVILHKLSAMHVCVQSAWRAIHHSVHSSEIWESSPNFSLTFYIVENLSLMDDFAALTMALKIFTCNFNQSINHSIS